MRITRRRIGVAAGALVVLGAAALAFWWRDATLRREEWGLFETLRAEKRAFEESEETARIPVPADPAPGRARDHWLAAAQAFAALEASFFGGRSAGDWLDDLGNWDAGPPSVPAGLRDGLADVAALLEPATRTARLPAPWRIVNWEDPDAPGPDDLIRHLLQVATWPLLDEARLRAAEGHADAALDIAFLVDRTATDAGENNWLLPSLASRMVRVRVRRMLGDLLSGGRLPPESLDRLGAGMRSSRFPELSAERASSMVALESQAQFFHPGEGTLVKGPLKLRKRTSAEKAEEAIRGLVPRVPRSRRLALWREFRLTAGPLPSESITDYAARLSTRKGEAKDDASRMLFRFAAYWVGCLAENDAELRATDAALRIGIAFHRFRLREGRAPATIEEILPPDVSATPPIGTWAIEEDPDRKEPCFTYVPPGDDAVPLRIR